LKASADSAFLAELGIGEADTAEGYLFPATYEFHLDAEPREIVKRLVGESNRRWAAIHAQHSADLERLERQLGWGRRAVMILASMVEKEAAVDEERPLVASVFINRLTDPNFRPKRLQSDPTSAYACIAFPQDVPSCSEYAGRPTPAINHDPKNRYSTYVNDDLPPGPIANPGERSIRAVLSPAAGKYLYFVAKGGGRHTFSETLDQHNDAVRKLRSSP
jgi:UPF0755 protein